MLLLRGYGRREKKQIQKILQVVDFYQPLFTVGLLMCHTTQDPS